MAYLDNIAVFVRVVELGNLSGGGPAQRQNPPPAAQRKKELGKPQSRPGV